MYRTELVVDGVNIFRDKGQKSILRCRVYSWDKEITNTLLPAALSGTGILAGKTSMPIGTVHIRA